MALLPDGDDNPTVGF